MVRYLKNIFYLLGPDRGKLPALIVLALAASILDLASLGLIGPYVAVVIDPRALDGQLGAVIEHIGLPREKNSLLMALGFSLLAIFATKAIAAIGIQWVIIRFSQRQQVRLRLFLMQAYQTLPYGEYLRRNSSQFIYSIQSLTGQFSIVVQFLLRSMSDGVIGLVILSFLIWSNGVTPVFLLAVLGAMVLGYDLLFRRKLKNYGYQVNQANTKMVQGISEGIEGLKEIRILGYESYFFRRVSAGARKMARFQGNQRIIQTAPRYLLEFMVVTFVVLLTLSLLFGGQGLDTLVPTISVFGVAILRLFPMANTLSNSLAQLRFSRDGVDRLQHDLRELEQLQIRGPLTTSSNRAITKSRDKYSARFKKLELQGVNFQYQGSPQEALRGISCEIRAGESVGLIGASGSGKTTLVDVFLGLLEPKSGRILYNGQPLARTLLDWRRQVAYLPQEVFLIDSSLRQNIALGVGEGDIQDLAVQEALRRASLQGLVDQLPAGIETELGERGVRLSGGQRQRVALARAFYHDRDILIMDEATSALDEATEREIVHEIKRLKGHVTMIVIAHRLSTVQYCDRIYRLDQGCIVDVGTPKELLS
jgi:ATP-binding cassette, subfamily B, bacterial PglK